MRCFEIAENETAIILPFDALRRICQSTKVSVELSTTFCPDCYTAIGTNEKVAMINGVEHHESCGRRKSAESR